MRDFGLDLVLAVRALKQSPGFAAAAIVTLALGIGANATMYSLADAVLFRPLSVRDADRIVHVFQRREAAGAYPLSYADYFHYRDHARSFDAIAAHYPSAPLHVIVNGAAESITGAVATASYFEVLQLQPALGRFFNREEDSVRGRDAVAVISHGFWQRRFGGDAAAVGSTIQINGRAFIIVGVASRGFTGVHPRVLSTDVWIPAAMFNVGYRYCDAFDRACRIVQLIARVRAGVTIENAQRELDVLAAQLAAADATPEQRTGVTVIAARGLGQGTQSTEQRQMQLFLGVVSLVLVIACANIAGLLLARSTARRRDVAMRLALGARRTRIVRQVLAESLVLAAAGGVAGLILSAWGADLLASLYAHDSAGRPVSFDLTLSGTVLAATAGLTLVAALLAGVAPALQASRADLVSVLKDEGASGGARRARLRMLLVGAQVAVSLVLLVGAALLIQSVQRVYQGPGFDPENLITMRLRPSLVDYSRERAHAFQREVLSRLATMPGVVDASPSVYMSMFSAGSRVSLTSSTGTSLAIDAVGNSVGTRYFATLGVPLIAGREFTDHDRTGAPLAVVVNDVLARRLWAAGHGIGQTLIVDGHPHEVVGIVADAQYYPAGDAPQAQVFFSYWQPRSDDAFLNDARMFVRVTGDAAAMMPSLRRAIVAVDPAVPVSEDYPVRDRLMYAFQPVRMAQVMLTAFAGLALVMSSVGLYGVLAASVTQRTREIGVRIALGASRANIAALVIRDGMIVTAAGLIIGLVAAWSSVEFVASLVFGIDTRDLTAFVVAPAVLIAVALAASYLPARRAVRVSPLTAIRTE